jgi:SP family general alpha glucoside:H+ symporter-like MFS transporter
VLFERGVSARKFSSTVVERIDGRSERLSEKERALDEDVMVERVDSKPN